MAAGIGSRFGTGIKQLEPVDASNHIIMDYSIHDAIEAGFNHVVFIIRKDIEKEFKEVRTLLNRNLWLNPLSDVMGGWGIWETVNGEQKLTTECIENVIMMVPFSAVVMWTFGEKIGNGWKKILWQSGKIAFIFSVSIEMLQLLLRLGTFQLSDIFYNTVGGVLGGVCYCGIKKVIQKM